MKVWVVILINGVGILALAIAVVFNTMAIRQLQKGKRDK